MSSPPAGNDVKNGTTVHHECIITYQIKYQGQIVKRIVIHVLRDLGKKCVSDSLAFAAMMYTVLFVIVLQKRSSKKAAVLVIILCVM